MRSRSEVSPLHLVDAFLHTAEVSRSELHLVHHQLIAFDKEGLLLELLGVGVRADELVAVHRKRLAARGTKCSGNWK